MIQRLQPYFANFQKRLSKSAKLHFGDTGLLDFLAGLRSREELVAWPRRGASFEGLVIEELISRAALSLARPEVYFWRTQADAETDLLIVNGRQIVPFEVKFGATVDPRTLKGLQQCFHDLNLKHGYVVHGGMERRMVSKSIELLPWEAIACGEIVLPFKT